jgi:hypothetical protein
MIKQLLMQFVMLLKRKNSLADSAAGIGVITLLLELWSY